MRLDKRLAELLGARVIGISPLGGGSIATVRRCDLADGRAVVAKTGSAGLVCEARMLRYLKDHTALPVPEVIHAEDDLLILEYCDNDARLGDKGESDAARHVAALHAHLGPGYGFAWETRIGPLPQSNAWGDDWPTFFAGQRLFPMARACRDAGGIDGAALRRVEALIPRLHGLLPARPPPSLLHGDLWGGNILSLKGRVTGFIDPALYFGDAEMDLAFITLFASVGAAFFNAYQSLHPIEPGFFEERRDLYNLWPLLVHARLFGGGYGAQAATILARFTS
jgi:fructosamine-3-kinase